MKSFITLTVAAFTLASCGGGGLNSTTRDIGILSSGFVATYDGGTDEVVLTVDGVEEARWANDSPVGGFASYIDGTNVALYAETISGNGAVFVVSSATVDLDLAGVQVARLGETDLPSSGSATFNGEYAGIFIDEDLVAVAVIEGDAELTADFGSATISGDITNRVSFGSSAEDILLLPTAITSAGAFSGTTTGGEFTGATTSNGEYVGLIVGDTGNEVVGGLTITQFSGARGRVTLSPPVWRGAAYRCPRRPLSANEFRRWQGLPLAHSALIR